MSVEIGKIDVKGIVRRRKKLFVSSFALIFLICLIAAFALPSVYRATVMIVVENQEIPNEYVKSTITSFVSERLHILTEKMLGYTKLLAIIEELGLYPDLTTSSEKVQQMRDDIELKTIDVVLKESSARGKATVAFTLSYDNKNPRKAKAAVNTLANLYVQEDQKTRELQAGTTTLFLEKELEELRRQVRLNEEKISQFKAANINQLPGSTPIFTQAIFRLEQEIDSIDTRIRTSQEKIVYLRSQIANIDPQIPILTEDGEVASNPSNRLKYLRLKLIRLQASLSDRHPDIIQLKSEIAELENQVGVKDTTYEQANRLKIVEKQIIELKSKYGDKHPDVIALSKEADMLQRQIDSSQGGHSIEDEPTDNPGYMNIKAQIIVAETEIEALREERAKALAKLDDYQKRLESMPFIDEQYNSLTLDFANTKQKFNEVANKLHSARLAREMDMSESGARFRIDSPARLPEKPVKPNRLLIILMGIVLGLGSGVVLSALAEGLDSSVKASDELESIAGVPVLATVSFVDSPIHRRLRRTKRLLMTATVLAVVMVASLLINWFVMPMDELWAKVERRLVEIGVPIEDTEEAKEL